MNDDWEALADRIAFPIQFFTTNYSFVIHNREEYLQKLFGFHQRISEADPTVFGSCVYGFTCLDHLIVFSTFGDPAVEENLKITAISVVTPLWPEVSVTKQKTAVPE